jgi:hypothetical protein
LDLLGFIRPNRDFSIGYGRKNKKSTRVSSCMRSVSADVPLFLLGGKPRLGWPDLASGKGIAWILNFVKQLHIKIADWRIRGGCIDTRLPADLGVARRRPFGVFAGASDLIGSRATPGPGSARA